MRKGLSISQFMCLAVAAILTGVPMFRRYVLVGVPMGTLESERMVSIPWVTMDQGVLFGGKLLTVLFWAALAAMAIVCFLDIFEQSSFAKSKKTIIIAAVAFVLGLILIVSIGNLYEFFTYKGADKYWGMETQPLAYVELVLLAMVAGAEGYKQFRL